MQQHSTPQTRRDRRPPALTPHTAPRRAATARAVTLLTILCTAALLSTPTPRHATAVAPAQTWPLELEITGEAGSVPSAVAADAGRFYVAQHSRLAIIDPEAAPDRQLLALSEPLGERIDGLAARDGLVVTTGSSLRIIDVRDPSDIHVLGRLPLRPLHGGRVLLVGDEAWVLRGINGVLRIDIADPTAPRELGHWSPHPIAPNGAPNVVVDAAVMADERVALLQRTSNPVSPPRENELTVVQLRAGAEPEIVAERTLACCESEVVAVGDWLVTRRNSSNDVLVFDGTAAQLPQARRWSSPGSSITDLVIGGETLWIGEGRSDWRQVSDIPAWRVRGPYQTVYRDLRQVVAADAERLFVGAEVSGWLGADGAAAAGPSLESAYLYELEPGPRGVWAIGGHTRGLRSIYELHSEETRSPLQLRKTAVGNMKGNPPHTIAAEASRIHVAGEWEIEDFHVDASGRLTQTARHEAADGFNFLGIHMVAALPETVLYRVQQSSRSGHHVLFLRGREPGVEAERLKIKMAPSTETFGGAVVLGTRVWTLFNDPAVGAPASLQAWDIEGPKRGTAASARHPVAPTGASLLAGAKDALWIASGNWVRNWNVRDPDRPVEMAAYELQGIPRLAGVSGDQVWVGYGTLPAASAGASAGGGLLVLDIGGVGDPRELAHIDLGGPPVDLVVQDGVAWVNVLGAVQRYALASPPGPAASPTVPTAAPATGTPTRTPIAQGTPTVPPRAATATALAELRTPEPERGAVYLPYALAAKLPE